MRSPAQRHAAAIEDARKILRWLRDQGVPEAQRAIHGSALLAALRPSRDPRSRRVPQFDEVSSAWVEMRQAEAMLIAARFVPDQDAAPPETPPPVRADAV